LSRIIKSGTLVQDRTDDLVLLQFEVPEGNGLGTAAREKNDRSDPTGLPKAESFLQAGLILKNARDEAAALLSDAEQRGEEILRKARDEAERIKDDARKEGLEAGYAEGERAAREEVAAEVQKIAEVLDSLLAYRTRMLAGAEEDILKLSLIVAEKIVRKTVAVSRDDIHDLVAECLRELDRVEEVFIRVNPAAAESLQTHLDDLVRGMGQDVEVEVIPDETISPGGCMVETESGCIDGRLETRLRNVSSGLLRVLEGGTDEPGIESS